MLPMSDQAWADSLLKRTLSEDGRRHVLSEGAMCRATQYIRDKLGYEALLEPIDVAACGSLLHQSPVCLSPASATPMCAWCAPPSSACSIVRFATQSRAHTRWGVHMCSKNGSEKLSLEDEETCMLLLRAIRNLCTVSELAETSNALAAAQACADAVQFVASATLDRARCVCT